jgi:site-specific DNA recombinase
VIMDRRKDRVRIQCSSSRESGVCKVTRRISLNDLEKTVVDRISNNFDDTGYLAEYIDAYNDARRSLASDGRRQRSQIENRLSKAEAGLARLINALADGTIPVDLITPKIKELEIIRDAAQSELSGISDDTNVISLHPEIIRQYKKDIAILSTRIGELVGEGDPEATDALRRLISSVRVYHAEKPIAVDVEGRLAALTGAEIAPIEKEWGIPLVAGEGREPPTRGL